jgi:hypothetical protein
MKELKKRDMQLHMGKSLGFLPYSEFLDVLKHVFFTKVQVRIDQLMEDILQGASWRFIYYPHFFCSTNATVLRFWFRRTSRGERSATLRRRRKGCEVRESVQRGPRVQSGKSIYIFFVDYLQQNVIVITCFMRP